MIPFLGGKYQELAYSGVNPESSARHACLLARCGKYKESEEMLKSLRIAYGNGVNARVSVLIMLAEGLLLYYRNLSDAARDRVARAFELSRVFGLKGLVGLTAAWLAQLEFESSNYWSMSNLCSIALEEFPDEMNEVFVRVGLVLGSAYISIGDRRVSQRWFELARSYAIGAGDRVAIGALVYNRVSFALAWCRAKSALNGERLDRRTAQMLAIESDSNISFNQAIGVQALDHLSRISQARCYMLLERWEMALENLERIYPNMATLEDRLARTPLLGDLALCYARLGRLTEAAALIELAGKVDFSALHCDDKVVLIRSLQEVSRVVLDSSHEANFSLILTRARSEYRDDLQALADSLSAVKIPSGLPLIG